MHSNIQFDTAATTTGTTRLPDSLCTHTPTCPTADSPDREAAQTIASYPEQGWSLLCNGVLVFDDTGDLLPDGRIVDPHRPTDGALSFQFTDAHALIGGTSGSGKTSAAAAMHKAGVLAGTAGTPRLA